MGQKVHPKVFRLGTIYTTSSKWFAKTNFRQFLKEDVQIRRFLKIKLREAGVGKIEIERSAQSMNVIIYSAKPGIIIGRGGAGIENVKKAGAKGVKIMIGGRLDGAEIARSEMLSSGSLPLHTLRADVDYARGAAMTTYGTIGVKVWIYKGEVFAGEGEMAPKPMTSERTPRQSKG